MKAFTYALFAVIGLYLLTLLAGAARAHGEAEWIMRDPSYVAPNGVTHCCGPQDCRWVNESEVTPVQGGFVITATGQFIPFNREYGVYPSIDDHFWLCTWGGEVKCIFYPIQGT